MRIETWAANNLADVAADLMSGGRVDVLDEDGAKLVEELNAIGKSAKAARYWHVDVASEDHQIRR